MRKRQLAPLLSVVAAALLGLFLLAQAPLGSRALVPASTPSPTFATSRPPSPGVTVSSTPTVIPPIPDGFRVRVPRLRIDLPIAEGIVRRDVELQQTPRGSRSISPARRSQARSATRTSTPTRASGCSCRCGTRASATR